jgi:hypothetical protein
MANLVILLEYSSYQTRETAVLRSHWGNSSGIGYAVKGHGGHLKRHGSLLFAGDIDEWCA